MFLHTQLGRKLLKCMHALHIQYQHKQMCKKAGFDLYTQDEFVSTLAYSIHSAFTLCSRALILIFLSLLKLLNDSKALLSIPQQNPARL